MKIPSQEVHAAQRSNELAGRRVDVQNGEGRADKGPAKDEAHRRASDCHQKFRAGARRLAGDLRDTPEDEERDAADGNPVVPRYNAVPELVKNESTGRRAGRL